ncbi:unnamed protein product [Rhodiola kirilowii]
MFSVYSDSLVQHHPRVSFDGLLYLLGKNPLQISYMVFCRSERKKLVLLWLRLVT